MEPNRSEFWGMGYNAAPSTMTYERMVLEMANSGSPTHLVMTEPGNGIPTQGDIDFLWRVYEFLYAVYGDKTRIIWRIYSPKEGNWTLFNRSVMRTALEGKTLPPNTIVDAFSNEPSLAGQQYQTNEEFVEWELWNIRMMREIGHSYAAGAFSTGTPHEDLISSGVYDRLIREAEYFSMHLYGNFPFEAGETLPFEMILPNDSNYQSIRDLYLGETDNWGENYFGWFFGRLEFWEARAKFLNVLMPETLITEAPFDTIDFASWIKSDWRATFGQSRYNFDARGVLTWLPHINKVFPELSIGQAMEKILVHLKNKVLDDFDFVRGIYLFGLNIAWREPQGHDWLDPQLNDFRNNYLKKVNGAIMTDSDIIVSDLPKIDQIRGRNGIVNLRIAPTTDSVKGFQGLTKDFIPCTIHDESVPTLDPASSSYKGEWVYFSRHEDDTLWYAAKDYVDFLNVPEDQEDDKWIIETPMTMITTRHQLDNVIDIFENLGELFYEADNSNYDPENETDTDLLMLFSSFLSLRSEMDDESSEMVFKILDRFTKDLKSANKF